MIQRQQSMEDILKDHYIKTLSAFLRESTLYDCLSINNQVTVVDQSFSLLDVFRVFIDNHIDEVLFWNPDVANYDGVFTHTDLIKVALKCYSNVLLGIPNVWATNKTTVTPIMEEEEEEHQSPVAQAINGKLSIDQFNKLLQDFKTITMKLWYNSYGEDLHQSTLILGQMEDSLIDSYRRILKQNITRILVTDQESKMIVGVIQQRDILAFLVKGFNQYFYLKMQEHHQNNQNMQVERKQHEQHELEIGYFSKRILQLNYTMPHFAPLYDVFFKSVHTLHRNSIAIIDDQNKYMGMIDRRDFILILKYQMFDILSAPASQYLQLMKQEKSKYSGYHFCQQETFNMKQTLKEVVENLLLSSRGSLVCLNNENEVMATLQTSDLFKICLDEAESD